MVPQPEGRGGRPFPAAGPSQAAAGQTLAPGRPRPASPVGYEPGRTPGAPSPPRGGLRGGGGEERRAARRRDGAVRKAGGGHAAARGGRGGRRSGEGGRPPGAAVTRPAAPCGRGRRRRRPLPVRGTAAGAERGCPGRHAEPARMSNQRRSAKAQLRRSLSEQLRDSTAKAWDLLWRNVRERRLAGQSRRAAVAAT